MRFLKFMEVVEEVMEVQQEAVHVSLYIIQCGPLRTFLGSEGP